MPIQLPKELRSITIAGGVRHAMSAAPSPSTAEQHGHFGERKTSFPKANLCSSGGSEGITWTWDLLQGLFIPGRLWWEAMKVAEEPAQRFPPSWRTSLQTWGLILGWWGAEKCWPPAQVPSGLGSAAALDLAWKSYLRSQVFVAIQPDWVTDVCTGNLVFRHCPLRSEQGFPVIPKPQSFFIVLTLINPKNSGNISHSGSKWQACMASPRWWNAVILDNSLLAPPATPGHTCHSRSKSLLLIIRRSTYMAFFIQRSPTSVYKLQFSLKTQ